MEFMIYMRRCMVFFYLCFFSTLTWSQGVHHYDYYHYCYLLLTTFLLYTSESFGVLDYDVYYYYFLG